MFEGRQRGEQGGRFAGRQFLDELRPSRGTGAAPALDEVRPGGGQLDPYDALGGRVPRRTTNPSRSKVPTRTVIEGCATPSARATAITAATVMATGIIMTMTMPDTVTITGTGR